MPRPGEGGGLPVSGPGLPWDLATYSEPPAPGCATVCSMKNAVGVRELRQNLSQYLRRVEKGETLEVQERGKPIAILAPLPEHQGALERLRASVG